MHVAIDINDDCWIILMGKGKNIYVRYKQRDNYYSQPSRIYDWHDFCNYFFDARALFPDIRTHYIHAVYIYVT